MDEAQRRRARLAELESEVARLRAEVSVETSPLAGALGVRPAAASSAALREGLSKREALLVEAERVAHLGSWAWNLHNGEIGWSDEFYRILDLDPARVQPSSEAFFAAIHPADLERVQAASQRSLSQDAEPPPIEFRIVRPSGEIRELRMEGAVLHTLDGANAHVVGAVLDITEQRRSARMLARTVAELNEAHHIAQLASWSWDAFSSQLEWSDGMYRLLGLPRTTAASDALFDQHIHADDAPRVRSYREQALTLSDLEPVEFRIVQAGGRELDVVLRMVAHWDPQGRLASSRGVLQDITERKALEEQLRHSQKMEAVGTLAGGIAHDFNNYLMVIGGYSQLLGEQLPPHHALHESVEAIGEAYQRCAQLTQQLLTLSRKRRAEPIPIDLSSLVAGLAPLVRSLVGDTVRLRLALQPDGMVILADPLQIEQALMNLVVNARDAMPQGGELTVSVAPRPAGPDQQAFVRLSVADTGSGIRPEIRARIFEPFFTTKQVGQGTGLGLSTVYAIVCEAGARIEFESKPGSGTRFDIDWPRCEIAARAPRTSWPARDVAGEGKRTILLVEDVARVRELLMQQLMRAGYRVSSAPNGVAALEQLAQEPCDLVLSDMIMPQLGGVELAREIRARYPAVRCLLMTGYSADAVHASDPFEQPILRKPFTVVELLQAIRRVLEPPQQDA
jgi:PAS domain S-box-containing protein